jgi:hypothetical protein
MGRRWKRGLLGWGSVLTTYHKRSRQHYFKFLIRFSIYKYRTCDRNAKDGYSREARGNNLFLAAPIEPNLHSFHRRHPVFDCAVNDGKKGFDLFRRIDDLDDDR